MDFLEEKASAGDILLPSPPYPGEGSGVRGLSNR
jgi:hypothetical protein